jgi:hypothetical protein
MLATQTLKDVSEINNQSSANSQSTQEKKTANTNLLTSSHLKFPNNRHGRKENENVCHHIRSRVADIVVVKVVSVPPGLRIDELGPEIRYWLWTT